MRITPTMINHPTQQQLVEFAESLVARYTPVSALMAAHVTDCPICALEVKKIRSSFELAALAELPPPSRELTQRIIVQAQKKRCVNANTNNHYASLSRFIQMAAGTAAAIVLAYFSFGAVMNDMDPKNSSSLRTSFTTSEVSPVYEELQKQTATVQALSASVSLQKNTTFSSAKQDHQRSLKIFDNDMSAARSALERNPGCIRANQVMLSSVERQLEGLRNLYLDRKL
ncbi:MAG: hypothetical protein KAH38_02605 [Candidatus Hydrogenedentes bacterium]|nr:hypothetical protein [Candidatus Hydrogenedentota bacterium]